MRAATLILLVASALCRAEGEAMYLGNAGLMVTDGDTKILFDPLFRNSYGQYQLVPADLEARLLRAEPPFDGIDAVFISHYHGDHFSPPDVLDYLRSQPGVRLFAPRQAVDAMRFFVDDTESALADRLSALDIDYGEPMQVTGAGALLIEAFHIPHSGWPQRTPEVQNLAFRITLNEQVTVLHMGDADTREEHFAADGDQWAARHIDMAFPPYWYFASPRGRAVLEQRLKPAHAVGIHVPVSLAPDDEQELEGRDLFRRPGETRLID